MGAIRELAEQVWTEGVDLDRVHRPVATRTAYSEELHERVLVFTGLANTYAVDTGDGLVLLDTGHELEARAMHAQVRAWRPDTPLYGAVYSHHHVDHVFGVVPFDAEAAERGWRAPVVYAHADVAGHLDRYRRTPGLNTALNRRQFAVDSPDFRWPTAYRYPDVSHRDGMVVRRGDLTLDLRHARGETDDATWTWIPEIRALHTGDLFIWTVPNAGNPQKVQRYAGEWAAALREMAARGAELLLPGHGLPIHGADRVRRACTETAEYLESLEAQTLALMDRGLPLDTVLHEVTVPDHLAERPYLRPIYDHPQFLVRNVWRHYGGWYDGEPDNLLPAPRADQAAEWVRLAGGVRPVLDRAARLHDAGDSRLACHLVEAAVRAEPDDPAVHELRARVYGERAAAEPSLMVRNILDHAARSSRAGLRDLAGGN